MLRQFADSRAFFLLVVFHVAALMGCTGGGPIEVRGSVKMHDEAVPNASVTFTPATGGRPVFAVTDEDGSFQIEAIEEGPHTVTILAVDEVGSQRAKEKAEALAEEHGSLSEFMQPTARTKEVWLVPEEYADATTSGLEFEVLRGGENQADFHLQD